MPFFSAFLLAINSEATHIPLVLLLVFGTAKIFAEICERLGQPGSVGEILAGVLLGPSVLNWVQPDQILTALAEMGAMFLLFRVGLEVRASDLLRVGRTALLVAQIRQRAGHGADQFAAEGEGGAAHDHEAENKEAAELAIG